MVNQNDINALKILAIDAVQKANSGHPGMPMGMAEIATVLWQKHLKHNPNNPQWINRDRFVLSNGHGSMLLYALLHLTGYDLPINQLKAFRQLDSQTPGHPEKGHTPGVEVTTGPLGQGLANAVGMAIAQSQLAAQYNHKDLPLFDHHIYTFCGDGCLMEGISHEACSLAGTLKLNKLIVFWDNNGISIDGPINNWFNESVCDRFKAYHWHVQSINGHDPHAIDQAIKAAKKSKQPSLIDCRTTIGNSSSPNLAGTEKCHGEPLGENEIIYTRKQLNWPYKPFEIPNSIQQSWCHKKQGQESETIWQTMWTTYQKKFPEIAPKIIQRLSQQPNPKEQNKINQIQEHAKTITQPMATRKASKWCLDALATHYPQLFGGSADLTPSNLTKWDTALPYNAQQYQGNYLHYGVREFAQFAIVNGINTYQGFHAFAATFLTFVDYGKNALRLAAMMKIPSIFIFTHDSIGLGEDGPTHQPIEHLAHLRAIPNMNVWRPSDLQETLAAWQDALNQTTQPTCITLSRQTCPQQIQKGWGKPSNGAYVLSGIKNQPAQLILLATGSEVQLITQAAEILREIYPTANILTVSMPSINRFLKQNQTYQTQILPPNIPKIIVEAAHPQSWYNIKRDQDYFVGVDAFGYSAPGEAVFQKMGVTVDVIIHHAKGIL